MNSNDAKHRLLEVLVLAEAAATFSPSPVEAAPGTNAVIQHKWLFARTAYAQILVQTTQERLENPQLFHSLLFMTCVVF